MVNRAESEKIGLQAFMDAKRIRDQLRELSAQLADKDALVAKSALNSGVIQSPFHFPPSEIGPQLPLLPALPPVNAQDYQVLEFNNRYKYQPPNPGPLPGYPGNQGWETVKYDRLRSGGFKRNHSQGRMGTTAITP